MVNWKYRLGKKHFFYCDLLLHSWILVVPGHWFCDRFSGWLSPAALNVACSHPVKYKAPEVFHWDFLGRVWEQITSVSLSRCVWFTGHREVLWNVNHCLGMHKSPFSSPNGNFTSLTFRVFLTPMWNFPLAGSSSIWKLKSAQKRMPGGDTGEDCAWSLWIWSHWRQRILGIQSPFSCPNPLKPSACYFAAFHLLLRR